MSFDRLLRIRAADGSIAGDSGDLDLFAVHLAHQVEASGPQLASAGSSQSGVEGDGVGCKLPAKISEHAQCDGPLQSLLTGAESCVEADQGCGRVHAPLFSQGVEDLDGGPPLETPLASAAGGPEGDVRGPRPLGLHLLKEAQRPGPCGAPAAGAHAGIADAGVGTELEFRQLLEEP